MVTWLGNPAGVAWSKGIQLIAEDINKKGGMDVAGEKYNIETIVYDSNNNQGTGLAAANRLIFEDNVKFVLADTGGGVETISPVAEKSQVIVSAVSPMPQMMTPDHHYTFITSATNCSMIVTAQWFMNEFPDKKTVVFLAPDMQMGHMIGGITVATLKNMGMNISDEYYPFNQQDLSALGTKIKTLNPDVVITPTMEPIKPIMRSGWAGQMFCQQPYSIDQLLSMASTQDLEGFIGVSIPEEYDPALTPMAVDFKQSYIQKYGRWESMDMLGTQLLWAVLTAIQKAGSVDTDKVAAVFGNSLTWDSPAGSHKMVARNDLGNSRTIDSVSSFFMKQIRNGKAVLLETINLDTSEKYFNDYLSKAPPPQAPPGAK
jgi:branched-chain amino acid transport system substrate-binding protein